MSALDPAQLEVAQILFGLPEADGYALAGGSALLVSGTIERQTRDIDAFMAAQPGPQPGCVKPLATKLSESLSAAGWTVNFIRTHDTFTRLTASRDGSDVEVDLAIDSPPLFQLNIIDGLPVLAGQDLAARKVLTIIDRAEGRDFTDLHALARQYSESDCIDWAKELDNGVTNIAIANAFSQLTRLDDNELPTTQPGSVRDAFALWAKELADT